MNSTTEVASSTTDPVYVIYFLDDLDQPAYAFTVTIKAATGEVIETFITGSHLSNETDENQPRKRLVLLFIRNKFKKKCTYRFLFRLTIEGTIS